ncbi:MAG: PQQ-binding-like beta-propeller repeat protein, partial [Candidatus Eisenbacteria bacterium]
RVVVWTLKAGGPIRSRPLLEEGLVYVTSYDGKLRVVDAEAGASLCEFDTRAQIYSSPALLNGRVYFGTNRGDFYCVMATKTPT